MSEADWERGSGGGEGVRMMTDFLAGDEGGDGFGVDVLRSSIPPAGKGLLVDTAAVTFLTAGGPEAVRLMS
jgi:hypothetical protein